MLEIAQGKADANNVKNVYFERSGIDEFSAPDQTLDAVLGLSILHLLENKEKVIAKVHKMLKPGGVFITSTACMGDTMKYFKLIAPIGKFFGVLPVLRIFTAKELEDSMTDAGFEIPTHGSPAKAKACLSWRRRPGRSDRFLLGRSINAVVSTR